MTAGVQTMLLPPQPPSYDRDSDLVSIHSACPSYTSSKAPSYKSTQPTPAPVRQRYQSLFDTSTPTPTINHHQYNVASWPSHPTQNRTYLNVAARRARRAQEAEQIERDASVIRRAMETVAGMNAAEAASQSSSSLRREDPLLAEQRAWDFFASQITDWGQREVSWNEFRARHQSQKQRFKNLGKRLGVYSRFG